MQLLTREVVVDGVRVLIGEHDARGPTPRALLVGTVEVVDGRLVIRKRDRDDVIIPVFPNDAAVGFDVEGRLTVQTWVGELRVGDVVGLGGGTAALRSEGGEDKVSKPSGGFMVCSIQPAPER